VGDHRAGEPALSQSKGIRPQAPRVIDTFDSAFSSEKAIFVCAELAQDFNQEVIRPLERETQNQGRFRPAFAEAPALRKASGGGATRRQVQVFLGWPVCFILMIIRCPESLTNFYPGKRDAYRVDFALPMGQ
jgi:hypothetical protein